MNPYEMISPVPNKASDLQNDSSLSGVTVKDALDGVTTSLAALQPLDVTLTALAGADWAANAIPVGTGADTVVQTTFAANTFPARASTGDLVAKTITDYGLSLVDDVDSAAARTTLGLGTVATLTADIDGTLVANSDTRVATQKAVKTYVDTTVTGVLRFKGSQDCSGNPNYPAALKGDAYIVSVAGKIGGASGKSVDIGDVFAASADNAGGDEATVGASWFVLEHNLVGALLSANNLSDLANAATAVNNLGGAASTGTDGLVRSTNPVLTTPNIGVASATSVNKMAITAPATGSTLTVADGKTLTASNTLTLAGTDGSTLNVGAGGTLGALALKSSVDLSGSDATGTLAAARMPALTGDITSTAGAVATTIGNNTVTFAKMQQVAANSLVGNSTGSTANAAAVGLTSNLKMTGGNLDTAQDIQTTSNFQAATLGVGTAPSSLAAAKLLCSPTDLDGWQGISMICVNRTTASASKSGSIFQLPATVAVSDGVTNSGIVSAALLQVYRGIDTSAASDGGTLAKLNGAQFNLGHVNLTPSRSPQTTNAYGVQIQPVIQSGVIANFYNLFLASRASIATPSNWSATTNYTLASSVVKPSVGNNRYYVCTTSGISGGTEPIWNTTLGTTTTDGTAAWTAVNIPAITNFWGLYQQDAVAQNYIAGTLQAGHTGTPLAKIEGRATSGAQLVASYDASNYMGQTVSSTGLCTWTGAGTGKGVVLTDGLQAGIGSARVRPGGALKTNVTSAGNSGTTETDLHSFLIVGGTLANDGDSLEVFMDFQITNNGNTKQIKFYVDGGAGVFSSGAAAVAGQAASIRAVIKRLNATSTMTTLEFFGMTGSAWTDVRGMQVKSVNWSGSIIIKATGQSNTASNDIVQNSTIVKYNPANP